MGCLTPSAAQVRQWCSSCTVYTHFKTLRSDATFTLTCPPHRAPGGGAIRRIDLEPPFFHIFIDSNPLFCYLLVQPPPLPPLPPPPPPPPLPLPVKPLSDIKYRACLCLWTKTLRLRSKSHFITFCHENPVTVTKIPSRGT